MNSKNKVKYKEVLEILCKEVNLRKDYEINMILPWMRSRSKLFETLKNEILFDLILNLSFKKCEEGELIIKEGEKGDCMYIMLRGRVSVHQLAEDKTMSPNCSSPSLEPNPSSQKQQRQPEKIFLGHQVAILEGNAIFGEVALMNEDNVRTASVRIETPSDFLVISRQVYDRSVKTILKKELEAKTQLVNAIPLFDKWSHRNRRQLILSMRKRSIGFSDFLIKQNSAFDKIFFVYSGEIKLQRNISDESEKLFNGTKLSFKSIDLCMLGRNSIIGDIEYMMKKEKYLYSALASAKTDVYELSITTFDSLINKNPETLEIMKKELPQIFSRRFNKMLKKYNF